MPVTGTLDSGSTVELSFDIRDRDCFFVDVSAREQCRVNLEHLIHRSDDLLLEFFSVEGVPADRVLALAEAAPVVSDARLVDEGADDDLFEFVVSGPCVTTTLADTGAITRAVSAADGRGRVVADVPAHVDVRPVVETFSASHDRVSLVACRYHERALPIRTRVGARATLGNQLTQKQLEVLRTAYEAGYFDWPRKRTAEECAAALGISQPTFSQHIRIGQQKVFEAFFDQNQADVERLPAE